MSRRTSRRRAQRDSGGLQQLPWRQIVNPYSPIEALTAEQVEQIHDASLYILEDIGINFLSAEARDILRAADADVEVNGERVRFDRALIEQSIAAAPPEFTLHARNPAQNITVGGNHINFATVGSAPTVSDTEGASAPVTSRTNVICYVSRRRSTSCISLAATRRNRPQLGVMQWKINISPHIAPGRYEVLF